MPRISINGLLAATFTPFTLSGYVYIFGHGLCACIMAVFYIYTIAPHHRAYVYTCDTIHVYTSYIHVHVLSLPAVTKHKHLLTFCSDLNLPVIKSYADWLCQSGVNGVFGETGILYTPLIRVLISVYHICDRCVVSVCLRGFSYIYYHFLREGGLLYM